MGGGTDLYGCEVRAIGGGWLGEAWIDTCIAGSPCWMCRGRFAVDNALSWSWLRRTAAHEYFHLVQYGMSLEDSWFRESTATWSEKEVFPWDKRYAWAVPSSFSAPERGFSTSWAYADVHYWVYLEETQGRSFIPELWRRCCTDGWQATCERMLTERGSSFDEFLVQHALWCNATATRDDGRHFRDAAYYPLVSCQARNYFYPVRGGSVAEDALAVAGGSDYIRFFGPGTRDSLRIRIDGSPDVRDQRRYSVLATRGREQVGSTLAPDGDGNAVFTVPDWPGLDYVTLIVTNFLDATGDLHFTYDAEELGLPAPVLLTDLRCAPNPFISKAAIRLQVGGTTQPCRVTIFNAAGRRVRELPAGPSRQGLIELWWDADDDAGLPVPDGCYFVRAQAGPAGATTKVLYIR